MRLTKRIWIPCLSQSENDRFYDEQLRSDGWCAPRVAFKAALAHMVTARLLSAGACTAGVCLTGCRLVLAACRHLDEVDDDDDLDFALPPSRHRQSVESKCPKCTNIVVCCAIS